MIIGDTVRLTGEFRTFGGVLADPSSIQLKIYDYNQTLYETITVNTSTNKVSTGKYYYDYTVPRTFASMFYYEFVGDIDGTDAVHRKELSLEFAAT